MTDRKLPSPVYAAAGASEAALDELRKIPGKVDELRDRAKLEERAQAVSTAVRDNVKLGVERLRELDAEKVRSAAGDTAATLGERARVTGEKARATYADFVQRGETVAAGERSPIKVIASIANGADAESAPEAEATTDESAKPAKSTAGNSKPAAKKTAKKTTSKAAAK